MPSNRLKPESIFAGRQSPIRSRMLVNDQHVAVTAIEYGEIVVTVTSRHLGSETSSEMSPLPYVTSIAGGPLAGQTWTSRTWSKTLQNHVKAIAETADALASERA